MSEVEPHSLTDRQLRRIDRLADRVVEKAHHKDEFRALGVRGLFLFLRSRSCEEELQVRIFERGEETGLTLQSYRQTTYRGDSASPEGPLVVRVLHRENSPVLEPVQEDASKHGPHTYPDRVYPPAIS